MCHRSYRGKHAFGPGRRGCHHQRQNYGAPDATATTVWQQQHQRQVPVTSPVCHATAGSVEAKHDVLSPPPPLPTARRAVSTAAAAADQHEDQFQPPLGPPPAYTRTLESAEEPARPGDQQQPRGPERQQTLGGDIPCELASAGENMREKTEEGGGIQSKQRPPPTVKRLTGFFRSLAGGGDDKQHASAKAAMV